MTIREFSYWIAFYRFEPFGEEWSQTALQCAIASAAAGDKDASVLKFLPVEPPTDEYDREPTQAELDTMNMQMQSWAEANGIPFQANVLMPDED